MNIANSMRPAGLATTPAPRRAQKLLYSPRARAAKLKA